MPLYSGCFERTGFFRLVRFFMGVCGGWGALN